MGPSVDNWLQSRMPADKSSSLQVSNYGPHRWKLSSRTRDLTAWVEVRAKNRVDEIELASCVVSTRTGDTDLAIPLQAMLPRQRHSQERGFPR